MRIGSNTVASAYPLSSRRDFTTMSRNDLREWMNGEIKRGAMTLDESTPFVAMTLYLPVGNTAEAQQAHAAAMDSEQVDFVDAARKGVYAANSRGDDSTARLLESALLIMRNYQQ
ncbi:MAG: hypothetical protein IBJ03_10675 [Gemmatimonadaceae bacterium]|nr:hypothetical protein [Gemmatimonadaceae bacterium]